MREIRRKKLGLAGGPILLVSLLMGCSAVKAPPLQPIERKIDLRRFMGDWFVLASIPIDNFFVSEADSYNAVESYELRDDGSIQTTYTFWEGGFDGPRKEFRPVGFVHDKRTNTEWRMQFVWPFKSAYLIVYLDEDYETTIVGVPDRSHAWIMARNPEVGEKEYEALVKRLSDLGYDRSRLRRVPQRWKTAARSGERRRAANTARRPVLN